MGREETYQGALNRAQHCRNAYPEADYFCGLEGGLVYNKEEDTMLLITSAVVLDCEGNIGSGSSNSFYLPKKLANLVNQGMELGDADDLVFGRANSKQVDGAAGILTYGYCKRKDVLRSAMISALIPHRNKELYFGAEEVASEVG